MSPPLALDFTPLANAVARLAEGLARYRADERDDQIRDGLIQRFEFTYDLSHKLLRRALEAAAANPDEADRMSFPTLIRTASEQGLVGSDWARWRTWREMRNITSHAYDKAKAFAVTAAIPAFLTEAQDLLRRLTAPLPLATFAELAEAFDESDLPWKVDLVDRLAVSAEFGAVIDACRIAISAG